MIHQKGIILIANNVFCLPVYNTLCTISKREAALAGVAQWIEHRTGTEKQRVVVRFPVRAHAWVASPAPSRGAGEATAH